MSTRELKTSRRRTRRALKKAQKLIRDVGFAKNTFAVRGTTALSRTAHRTAGLEEYAAFCSLGAINAATTGTPFPAGLWRIPDGSTEQEAISTNIDAQQILQDAMGDSVSWYNDHHTREEVLAAFDKAIDSLKKENKK